MMIRIIVNKDLTMASSWKTCFNWVAPAAVAWSWTVLGSIFSMFLRRVGFERESDNTVARANCYFWNTSNLQDSSWSNTRERKWIGGMPRTVTKKLITLEPLWTVISENSGTLVDSIKTRRRSIWENNWRFLGVRHSLTLSFLDNLEVDFHN